jgi:PadR family transcriptional regulator, regulatory protein PadR
MKSPPSVFLGEFEQLVLLALLQIGESAYAINARDEIERRTGRPVARGAVYITLDRLEKKGYLESWLADPTPERGGRAKRYYRVQPAGIAALEHSRVTLQKMWKGLEPLTRKL